MIASSRLCMAGSYARVFGDNDLGSHPFYLYGKSAP
jgi:hypothetical protein